MRKRPQIVPIILAAGRSVRLPFPKPLARFGKKTAVQIAVENCAGLGRPVVVVGFQAARVRRAIPAGARVVVNRAWRKGQLGSLLAGLRGVPRASPFLLYPVDYPLLTRAVVRRLAAAFKHKGPRHAIVVPVFRKRTGHPVVFSSELRDELARARTAKEVVTRDRGRVKLVPVTTPATWQDYSSPATYRRRVREFLPHAKRKRIAILRQR